MNSVLSEPGMPHDARAAWERLLAHCRERYAPDELWTDGKPGSPYQNELKLRRGGKTIVTLYVRDGYFDAVIILGKTERETFETSLNDFSPATRKIYDDTRTYRDGKWLCLPVRGEADLGDVIALLNIKRKPMKGIVKSYEL